MAGLQDSLASAIKGVYCAAAGPASVGLGILGNVYKGLGGSENGEDLLAAAQLYRAGQQAYCDRQPDDVSGEIVPPFEGGQCSDGLYTVTANGFTVNDGVETGPTPVSSSIPRPGPLRYEVVRTTDGTNAADASVVDGNGVVLVSIGTSSTNPDVELSARLEGINVTLVSGSDDCGDPPPIPPEYDPSDWTSSPTVTYDGPDGSPVTVSPTVEILPHTIGPDGGLEAPVKITFQNNLSISANLELNTGDLNLFPGPGQPGSETSDPKEEEEGEEDEEDERDLIGVRVIATRTSQNSRATEVLQDGGNPDIYVPRVGNVAFLYKTGSQNEGWGNPVPVKGENIVVFAEAPALDVKGTADPGWSLTLRKVVKKRECGCE